MLSVECRGYFFSWFLTSILLIGADYFLGVDKIVVLDIYAERST